MNRGRLKHGNPSGDFSKAPRCGAQTRRGTSCLAPAMQNGRCRMHGGKSTGPKTAEGIQRIRDAHLKHGFFSKESIEERKRFNGLLKKYEELLEKIKYDESLEASEVERSVVKATPVGE